MAKIYKVRPCPKCGNYTNRGISVDAIIIKEGKILLVKRASEPFKDFWATPGGYVGWDETTEEAIIREIGEETGLEVEDLKFVGFSSFPGRHPAQVINFVYLAKVRGNPVKGDDAGALEWFDLDKLPEKLAFDHRENIKSVFKTR